MRLFSGVESGRVAGGGGPKGLRSPLLLDWFRLAAVAMMTMTAVMTMTMVLGTEGKDNNQLKAAVEEMVVMATARASTMVIATGSKIK